MKTLETRLWLPNQAALELYKNAISSRNEVAAARGKLDALLVNLDNDCSGCLAVNEAP